MLSKTIPFALRLSPSSLTRLKEVAAAHERSAGWWAARLIDEGMDRPETPPSEPEQPQSPITMAPVAVERRPRRPVFGAPKIEDHVYAAIEKGLIEHGMTLANGRQIVQWSKVVPVFHANPARAGRAFQLNRDQFISGMKTLLEEGAICRDEALVWIDEGADPDTTQQAASTAGLPPPAPRTRGRAPNYERLCRVLKYTLNLYGVTDNNGRQGVDEKRVRETFVAARIRENESDNKVAHNAAFNETMKRLITDGVAERDGSIIRVLNLS